MTAGKKENLQSCGLEYVSSPKIDQHQFAPNKISTQSREMVMRIRKMIA